MTGSGGPSNNDKRDNSGNDLTALQRAVAALEKMKARIDKTERAANEPIAIIGMSCRFPGGGEGTEAYWRTIDEGRDAVREILPNRWPEEAIPGKQQAARWAALLDEVTTFDANFFGIAPREAESLDPQQRMLLETTWEALEDAGQVPERLVGSRTGVYLGVCSNDYQQIVSQSRVGHYDAYCFTGNIASTAAGRISYTFGFQGPAISVDTACSSSLVALAQACQSLRMNDSEIAVVGGVNAILAPQPMSWLLETHALSTDGRCKTLDARANGYVRGEGCGVVILKRLSDAMRDEDRIHGLIRGWAINQDGRSTGLTTPNVLSQQAMLRQALERARIAPGDIEYVELHGTGTSLGDPIEFDALRNVLGAARSNDSTCVLGAVKTNIGHLEGAAGMAGLIKILLALRHERIPKNLHFKRLNPRISLEGTPFVVPTQNIPWVRRDKPRRAGISSFGISGTNAHFILEEPQLRDVTKASVNTCTAYLLPLSAKTPEALLDMARMYAKWFSMTNDSLVDIVHTASLRRTHHPHRLTVVASSAAEFIEKLQSFHEDEHSSDVTHGRPETQDEPSIVFVFSGQGSQWAQMGSTLLDEVQIVRSKIEEIDGLVQKWASFSVLEALRAPEETSRLNETEIAQPAIFAIQVAIAHLFKTYGISPRAVIGHSVGEIAAAHMSGALSLEDAVRLVILRGKTMQKATGHGKMVWVDLPATGASQVIAEFGRDLSIGAINDPTSAVLSGSPSAVDRAAAHFASRGIATRPLRVNYAFHSAQMEPLAAELVEQLGAIAPSTGSIPLYSTVTGKPMDGSALGTAYWGQNIRATVQFADAMRSALADGHRLFVEIGPHPVLLANIEQCARSQNIAVRANPTLRRNTSELRSVLATLGALHVNGASIAWSNILPQPGRVISLPAYPWQRQRFWVDSDPSAPTKSPTHRQGAHPLLGLGFVMATQPELHVWEQWISTHDFPFLADHRVQGEVVFPGASYIEMALAAGYLVYGERSVEIEDLVFEQMLALAKDHGRLVQVSLLEESGGRGVVTISSKQEGEDTWLRHASGILRVVPPSADIEPLNLENLEALCPTTIDVDQHYQRAEEYGLLYGKTFQGVLAVQQGPSDVIGRIQIPDEVTDFAAYVVHPALLDACFQAATWAMNTSQNEAAYVLAGASQLRLYRRPDQEVWIHGRIAKDTSVDRPTISVVACDRDGQVIFELEQLRLQALDRERAPEHPFADCVYDVQWRKVDLPETNSASSSSSDPKTWLVVVDKHDFGGALIKMLRERGDRVVEVTAANGFVQHPDAFGINTTDLAQWENVLSVAFGKHGCHGVIHCEALDAASWANTSLNSLESDIRRSSLVVLRSIQALLSRGWRDTPRMCLLTRFSQRVGESDGAPSVVQSMLSGLGRVIAMEQPDSTCIRIDLAARATPDEPAAVLRELLANTDEDQIALRPEGRYVARLVRGSWTNDVSMIDRREPAAGRPYRLEIREPGVLDRLALRPIERRAPGPGEVEVEVEVAGLNFLDVLLALGVLPDDVNENAALGPKLGGECAGRITRIGKNVTNFEVGQEVIALGASTMATHVIAAHELVIAKPRDMNWPEAATMPIVFLTAYYSLAHVAKLKKSERVLIHAGAGGVGMAAIQWAKHVGAEIFASAGSEEKRALLRSMGVHHVLDSRSLSFVDDVLRITNNEGVDVILNSLSGKFLEASFKLLRDYGRFIEIGKRDYYENRPLGLRPFLKNLSFSLVDLRAMMLKQPDRVAVLFDEVAEFFRNGVLHPIPCQVFPLSNAREAFALMAQGKHTGKLALAIREPNVELTCRMSTQAQIREDATYLIAGGLGGLGLSLAQWMATQGARFIVLASRSQPNAQAQTVIHDLQTQGITVRTFQVDIANKSNVNSLMGQIQASLPALRGVVHAAAVLADKTLPEMSEDEFWRSIQPKVYGAWNLHEATRTMNLDFFVMYSSAAGLLGSPGQSNYAAANTFLDALGHARVADGLPTTSIQWGPFAGAGLAAQSEVRGDRLSSRGTTSFSLAEGHALFQRVLEGQRPNIGLFRFDARQWIEFYPHLAGAPFLSELTQKSGDGSGTKKSVFRALLERIALDQRPEVLEGHVRNELGKVLRSDPNKIDTRAPFTSLGLDSLMSLELRNRLEASLGLKLAAALLFTYPSTRALTDFLLQKLAPEPMAAEPAPREAGEGLTQPAFPEEIDEFAENSTEENLAAESTPEDDLLAAFDNSVARIRGRHLR